MKFYSKWQNFGSGLSGLGKYSFITIYGFVQKFYSFSHMCHWKYITTNTVKPIQIRNGMKKSTKSNRSFIAFYDFSHIFLRFCTWFSTISAINKWGKFLRFCTGLSTISAISFYDFSRIFLQFQPYLSTVLDIPYVLKPWKTTFL